MPKSSGWVVKLGGSLGTHASLRDWLSALAALPPGSVVVPGGGAFRRVVEDTQKSLGYSDATAHRLAILAMAQYGLMLDGLLPQGLLPTIGLGALHVAASRPLLWIPTLDDVNEMQALPADWRVSADSIALWLAQRLKISRLALIKTAVPAALFPMTACSIEILHGLAAQAVVDPYFPSLAVTTRCAVHCFAATSLTEFIAATG